MTFDGALFTLADCGGQPSLFDDTPAGRRIGDRSATWARIDALIASTR